MGFTVFTCRVRLVWSLAIACRGLSGDFGAFRTFFHELVPLSFTQGALRFSFLRSYLPCASKTDALLNVRSMSFFSGAWDWFRRWHVVLCLLREGLLQSFISFRQFDGQRHRQRVQYLHTVQAFAVYTFSGEELVMWKWGFLYRKCSWNVGRLTRVRTALKGSLHSCLAFSLANDSLRFSSEGYTSLRSSSRSASPWKCTLEGGDYKRLNSDFFPRA